MTLTKLDRVRSARRWSKLQPSPFTRRGRERWTVRWIGAAKRRLGKSAVVKPFGGEVIELKCADTFERPVRADLVGTVAQLIRLQVRRDVGSTLAALTLLVAILGGTGTLGSVP